MNPSIEYATDLLLVGVSLDRTLRNAYTVPEGFLNRGGRLRVIVVDPRSDFSVAIADHRAYPEHGVDRRRAHIQEAIGAFCSLHDSTGGNVEIKVTKDPLTFGATMIDGIAFTSRTRIVVQHYSFKKRTAAEPNPVFVIYPTDAEWFAEFKEELENLWVDAAVWEE